MRINLPLPEQNKLLAALPQGDLARLKPHLQPTTLREGLVLYERGNPQKSVYFPTHGIVSLSNVMDDGSPGENAVVGNDGLIGVALFLGGESTLGRAVVLNEGHAYQLQSAFMKTEFALSGGVQRMLLLYTQSLITQMAQTAACNRHHSLEQRLCRRLLMSVDLRGSGELNMTQQLMANVLGSSREGVAEAAHRLRGIGSISYRRGRLNVLDRPALEARVCECYDLVRRESGRLFGEIGAFTAQYGGG